MATLEFEVKLKELPVTITDVDGAKKIYKIKELTGDQKSEHDKDYDYKVKIENGIASATLGDDFKIPSAKSFLALCFYDEKDVLVSPEVLGGYPSTMLEKLHRVALKLSGMDKASMEEAKNELEGKKDSGTE